MTTISINIDDNNQEVITRIEIAGRPTKEQCNALRDIAYLAHTHRQTLASPQ